MVVLIYKKKYYESKTEKSCGSTYLYYGNLAICYERKLYADVFDNYVTAVLYIDDVIYNVIDEGIKLTK